MVFSGRPSTACYECRRKRRKCDRALPSCSQCLRKQIPCRGYRDLSGLRLRDETSSTAQKVQKAKSQQTSVLSTSSHSSSPATVSASIGDEIFKPIESHDEIGENKWASLRVNVPTQPVECAATAYFMTSFIISSPFEEYLPYLYNSDPLSQDAVSTAIRASSLATFALRVRDSRHMRTARSHYALALARTNASLANPEEALLDSTLAAVLLLGLFEAVIFQGRQSPETWTIHTLGALELLRLRGIDQFQSKLAHRLFTQTITNIRTSCIQRIVPVPPECLALHNQAIRFLDPQDPTLRLGPIIDRAASIRARTKTHPCPQLIYEAIDLDQEALALTDSFEEKMDFGIRLAEDNPPWAYLGIAYRYPNHRVAKYWNAVRMIRMFLNELIWRGISFGFDNPHPNRPVGVGPCDPLCKCTQLEALKQKAIENLGKIAVDVLASVSDFLEPTKGRGKFCPSARALIWPLSILLTSSVYASSVKKHAVFLLHELGVDLNLPQAIDAAKLAYEPEMTEDWLHLSHLT